MGKPEKMRMPADFVDMDLNELEHEASGVGKLDKDIISNHQGGDSKIYFVTDDSSKSLNSATIWIPLGN